MLKIVCFFYQVTIHSRAESCDMAQSADKGKIRLITIPPFFKNILRALRLVTGILSLYLPYVDFLGCSCRYK